MLLEHWTKIEWLGDWLLILGLVEMKFKSSFIILWNGKERRIVYKYRYITAVEFIFWFFDDEHI